MEAGRQHSSPPIVVVGLGNPVLGDDGVGWLVVDEVERRLNAAREAGELVPEVAIERLGVGGIRLMEMLTDYQTAILVDAAEFADRTPGEVRTSALAELEGHASGHLDSAHDASLATALALGRRLGTRLPDRIDVVTIQARSTFEFSEELSPQVAVAVPVAAAAVMALLTGNRRV